MHNVLSVPVPLASNTFPSPALGGFGPIPYDSMALVLGADPRTHRLAVNPNPDPRAYLASSALSLRNDDEATEYMRAGHDFHHVALVEQPVPLPTQALPLDGHATITHFSSERISIAVESPWPALLVLAEPWYPGWTARVNGSSVPCIPANAWMRAVLVPAGKSQVEMTFHSTYLVLGSVISLVALAIILVLLFRRRAAQPA